MKSTGYASSIRSRLQHNFVPLPPWYSLGTRVEEAPDSKEALKLAGLDWSGIQKPIQTEDGQPVNGFKANIRDRDSQILGVVTDRYKVVQNEHAFAFTDECWARALSMKRQDPCRRADVPGFRRSLPGAIMISGDCFSI